MLGSNTNELQQLRTASWTQLREKAGCSLACSCLWKAQADPSQPLFTGHGFDG